MAPNAVKKFRDLGSREYWSGSGPFSVKPPIVLEEVRARAVSTPVAVCIYGDHRGVGRIMSTVEGKPAKGAAPKCMNLNSMHL